MPRERKRRVRSRLLRLSTLFTTVLLLSTHAARLLFLMPPRRKLLALASKKRWVGMSERLFRKHACPKRWRHGKRLLETFRCWATRRSSRSTDHLLSSMMRLLVPWQPIKILLTSSDLNRKSVSVYPKKGSLPSTHLPIFCIGAQQWRYACVQRRNSHSTMLPC